jgi:aspartyl-tRNA(Asn)/glutamyl-tRNA(Gln) amidotransferase subunit A
MNAPATLAETRDAVASGARSAVEVCQEALARIQATDPSLHAFHTVTTERALARAAEIDRNRTAFRNAPLAGIPVGLKDNICTSGVRTTASSHILETFVPPYDATVVTRLHAAGAILVGKTNCDEFAMGSSTENSAFGPSRNPWATDRIPGGSSGGSAVAVAAGMTPLSLGSETGGSIRQPAAMCGVFGLKPTYGRVSRYGLLAFGSSLDQIGPFTRTARDAAIALGAIAGADPADSTASHELVPDYAAALTGDIRGLRIGVPSRLLDSGVHPDILRSVKEAIATLRERGASVIDIELPHAKFAIPVYYLVATAEASSNLARYDGVRYGLRDVQGELGAMYSRTRERGFGAEVKRRIMLGTYVLSAGYYDAYYLKAQQVRTLILRDYAQAFERVDVVAMPTSPIPPFKLGERVSDPLQMYLADIFTVSANLAGLPAVSLPCGFTNPVATRPAGVPSGEVGLPIGLQLTGRAFDEATILRTADAYERDTEWWKQAPPIANR